MYLILYTLYTIFTICTQCVYASHSQSVLCRLKTVRGLYRQTGAASWSVIGREMLRQQIVHKVLRSLRCNKSRPSALQQVVASKFTNKLAVITPTDATGVAPVRAAVGHALSALLIGSRGLWQRRISQRSTVTTVSHTLQYALVCSAHP